MRAKHVLLLCDGRVVGGRVYPADQLTDEAIYAAIEQNREPALAPEALS
jgi:hypothetical protein